MTFASVRVANGVWTLKSLSLFTIIEAANRGPTGLVHLNAESLAARVALGLNRLPLCGLSSCTIRTGGDRQVQR